MGDGVRDGVAVRGANGERFQDEQIERALQQLSLHRCVSSFGHVSRRLSTQETMSSRKKIHTGSDLVSCTIVLISLTSTDQDNRARNKI